MPKTQVNFPETREVLTASNDPAVPDVGEAWVEPTLHVNWLNSAEGAGHVQVMLEVSEHYLKLALDSPNGDQPGTSRLWSPVLARDEINRMIRALRNARDKAYGADA